MDTLSMILAIVGSAISIILSVWALTERITKKFNQTVDKRIRERDIELKQEIRNERTAMIEAERASIEYRLEALVEDLGLHKEQVTHITEHQTKAILEAFKQEIRAIYYRLRSTGTITDIDKAYIDKIYVHYVALGGNSDIAAKYKEMCDVYSRRTHQAYDEKVKKNKQRSRHKKQSSE